MRLHDLVQMGIVNSPALKRATIKEDRREAVWAVTGQPLIDVRRICVVTVVPRAF